MHDLLCKNLDNSGQTWTGGHIRNGFGEQEYPESFVFLRHCAPSSPMTADYLLLYCKLFLMISQPAQHPLATAFICRIHDMLYFSLSPSLLMFSMWVAEVPPQGPLMVPFLGKCAVKNEVLCVLQ